MPYLTLINSLGIAWVGCFDGEFNCWHFYFLVIIIVDFGRSTVIVIVPVLIVVVIVIVLDWQERPTNHGGAVFF